MLAQGQTRNSRDASQHLRLNVSKVGEAEELPAASADCNTLDCGPISNSVRCRGYFCHSTDASVGRFSRHFRRMEAEHPHLFAALHTTEILQKQNNCLSKSSRAVQDRCINARTASSTRDSISSAVHLYLSEPPLSDY